MIFEPAISVLLCLFLCLCNGAPPEVPRRTAPGTRFSDQEDRFIVDEFAVLFDTFQAVNTVAMWEEIAKRHRKQVQEGQRGFSQERSPESLRSRFRNVLINNFENVRVELPESLLRKLQTKQQNRNGRGHIPRQQSYSKEEDNMIFTELLKPYYTSILSVSTLKGLIEAHKKQHRARARGFEIERSYNSIRSHLNHMRRNGQFPDNLKQKFGIFDKDASDSNQNQQIDAQGLNEEQAEEDLIDQMVDELQETGYEIDFTMLNPATREYS